MNYNHFPLNIMRGFFSLFYLHFLFGALCPFLMAVDFGILLHIVMCMRCNKFIYGFLTISPLDRFAFNVVSIVYNNNIHTATTIQ